MAAKQHFKNIAKHEIKYFRETPSKFFEKVVRRESVFFFENVTDLKSFAKLVLNAIFQKAEI